MIKMFRWFFAGYGNDLSNLLRRECGRTPRAGQIGQQDADGFAQAFGMLFQRFQVGATGQPALSPYPHRFLGHPQFQGDRFIGISIINFQNDRRTLHQSIRDSATFDDDIQTFLLFRGQTNRLGRAGHRCTVGGLKSMAIIHLI